MKAIDTMVRSYDARLAVKTPCTNKLNHMTIAQWLALGVAIQIPLSR